MQAPAGGAVFCAGLCQRRAYTGGTRMTWVALVGPETDENLWLRSLASALAQAGYVSDIVPFRTEQDLEPALAAILDASERPAVVGLSRCQAPATLALARALRERGF